MFYGTIEEEVLSPIHKADFSAEYALNPAGI
jgi:hypothetical protein